MSNRVLNGIVAGLLVVAITMIVAAYRVLHAPTPRTVQPGSIASVPTGFTSADLSQAGWVLGNAAAPVKIVEFADFQCPFCGKMVGVLDSLRRKHLDSVAVVFRHFPLVNIHPHAFDAAVAAECAGVQGRFREFHALLYERPTDIGTTPWPSLAKVARVPDTVLYSRCLRDSTQAVRVHRDIDIAERLGARGTPTYVIGNVRVSRATEFHILDSLVTAARQ